MSRNTFCCIVIKIDNNNKKYAHIIDTHMPTTLVQVFDSSWIHFNFHCHLSLVSLKTFQTTILTVHMDKYKTQWYVISYALFFYNLKKKAALTESRCTRDWSNYVKPYIFLDNLQKNQSYGLFVCFPSVTISDKSEIWINLSFLSFNEMEKPDDTKIQGFCIFAKLNLDILLQTSIFP